MNLYDTIMRSLTPAFLRRKKEISLLKEHPIFRDIDSWLNIKVGALDIKCPSKRAMAEVYLKIYFEEMSHFYNKLCENYVDYAKHPHLVYQNLHIIINATNDRAVLEYIPTLFLSKMSTRFFKHVDLLSQSIANSSVTRSYSTEFEQISSILDMSLLFLKMEVDAIEVTINDMNGELEKVLKGTIYDPST